MEHFASQDLGSYSLYFGLNIWFRARKVTGRFEKQASGLNLRPWEPLTPQKLGILKPSNTALYLWISLKRKQSKRVILSTFWHLDPYQQLESCVSFLHNYNSPIKQKGLLAKSINRPKLKARVLWRALAPGENHFLAFTELPATHRK